jgi:hypothetical protein
LFGAEVEVTKSTHNTGLNKFQERSEKGILVGYTDDSLMQPKVIIKGPKGRFGKPKVVETSQVWMIKGCTIRSRMKSSEEERIKLQGCDPRAITRT